MKTVMITRMMLLASASLLATACATTPGPTSDKAAAEKSKAYTDGISFVTAGHAGGMCAGPTNAQKAAMSVSDAPSKEWKDLLVKASACVSDKNWKTLEQVGETLARIDMNAPWGSYFLSVSAEARGDWQRALWMVDLALKKAGGQNGLFSYQRGRVLLGMKDTSRAMAEMNKAVALEPRLIGGHMFLAEIHYRDLEWDKAAPHYQAVLDVDDKMPTALAGLGEVRMQQGKPEEAAALFTRALAEKSTRADWWLRLAGICETSLKNNELALSSYKNFRASLEKSEVKPRPSFDVAAKIKSLEEAITAARQPASTVVKGKTASVKEPDQARSKK